MKSAEARLTQAKSQLKGAEAALAAAEAEFNRTKDLVDRRSLESRVLDEVRKKRDSQLAQKESLSSAIASAEADVVVAQSKLVSAGADLKVAEAETIVAQKQLEELLVLMEYATLKAPFAGVVTQRTVNPGDLVREANEVGRGQPLFAISQNDKVRIHIPVPESDAAFVQPGDSVNIIFPSFPDQAPLEHPVTRVAGELDPNTRTMLVEIELDNADGKLLPGMFGQATVTLSSSNNSNMLPARSVRFTESGEAYVYIVESNQTVKVAQVKTGVDTGLLIEVLSGVEPGQRVIDAHLKRFVDGQPVTLLHDERDQ